MADTPFYFSNQLNDDMEKKKVAFISHPLKGDLEGNTNKVKQICRSLINDGVIPLATHMLFPSFLDDNIPEERETGMKATLELLSRSDEVWVYGDRISEGMKREIELAKNLNIPVVYKSDKLNELNEKKRRN